MNALITGISGFVGGHLADHLLAAGDMVLGATRDGRWLPDFSLPIPLVAWDLGAEEAASDLCDRIARFAPDVIYHLAALSVPADCGAAGEPTAAALALNVDGVRRVLALAQRLPKRPRIVFTSSSKVYAPIDPAKPKVAEDFPCAPTTAYGRSKLLAEQVCEEAARSAADIVVVRSFNQAGPRQDPRLMLAEWAIRMAQGEPEMEVGGLQVLLDLLDVRDGVRALRKLTLLGTSGAVYNLGSGTSRTTGDVYRSLERAVGRACPVRERDPCPRVEPIADLSRLQSVIDWKPEVPLDRTTTDVWNYWRLRVDERRRAAAQQAAQQ